MRRKIWWVLVVMFVSSLRLEAGLHKHQTKISSFAKRWDIHPNIEHKLDEFKKALSGVISEERFQDIVQDPRFALDATVTGIGASGSSCKSYFDPCFGLLTDESLTRGTDYWREHKEAFSYAMQDYRVPPEVILGILRVETNFGKHRGKRPVLNTFWSIYAFSRSPKKQEWALRETRFLLRDVLDNNEDPFTLLGSWAGAFGIPQFLPSSYAHFAVHSIWTDPSLKSRVLEWGYWPRADLANDDDAIRSVANYLCGNGWGLKRKQKEHAVLRYNHEKAYMKAVLAYADAVKKRLR